MFNLIQLLYSGKLISSGQVYVSPARFVPSGQNCPLKSGNRKLHSRETSSALTGYVPQDKQARQGHRPDVCSPAGRGQSRRWRGETGCFQCHVAGKCVANQTMVVEERFEGWWGPANSSLGARINAIILFHSRKH